MARAHDAAARRRRPPVLLQSSCSPRPSILHSLLVPHRRPRCCLQLHRHPHDRLQSAHLPPHSRCPILTSAADRRTPPTPLGVILPALFGAGCTGYMDLSLGLVGIGPATAGVASVSVPIPSSLSLPGYTLSAQGLAINPVTGMLSASNGETGVLGY